MQSKDWIFTINNYTPEEENQLRDLIGLGPSYVIFGREVGESGTPHLQGFLQMERRSRRRTVSGLPGLSRAYLETRRGTVQQAQEYCKKEGNWEEFGDCRSQGKRTDLAQIKEEIEEGATDLELFRDHFGSMVRYQRGIQCYRELLRSGEVRDPPRILLIWGPTGVGKSRLARHFSDVFSLPDTTLRWFDGYQGQESVLLDDFDGEGVQVASFLRYFDRYNISVPVKGGFVSFKPKTIWITSNTSSDDWFPGASQAKRDAVKRRITKTVHLLNPLNFDSDEDMQRMKCLLSIE